MTDQIITDWMSDWKQLTSEGLEHDIDNLAQFAELILGNEDLFQAITHVLEECDRFRTLYNEVIAILFAFCRTAEKKLKLFSAEFIPSLVYVYLHQIHSQKKCIILETLLRGMFELEGTTDDKVPISARIPNIHLPSIYHDPGGVSTSWLSDGEMDRLTARTVKVVTRPNLVFTEERVRAPQRLPLCTELWWIFNYWLPQMSKYCIPTFLKTISKLTTQGFTSGSAQRAQPPVRIILSSKLLIEMVHTIYFSVYNGAPTLAEQVLEEALNRANYQLWPDAMLMCNAVRNYLKSSGHRLMRIKMHLRLSSHPEDVAFLRNSDCIPCDVPLYELLDPNRPSADKLKRKLMNPSKPIVPKPGEPHSSGDRSEPELPIQVEANTFKKSIITNASFRTKKLPEDIPIVETETIPEEGEHIPIILSKSKSKLPNILGKLAKRNSVVVINEEGDCHIETMATPPERKKSIDSTPV